MEIAAASPSSKSEAAPLGEDTGVHLQLAGELRACTRMQIATVVDHARIPFP